MLASALRRLISAVGEVASILGAISIEVVSPMEVISPMAEMSSADLPEFGLGAGPADERGDKLSLFLRKNRSCAGALASMSSPKEISVRVGDLLRMGRKLEVPAGRRFLTLVSCRGTQTVSRRREEDGRRRYHGAASSHQGAAAPHLLPGWEEMSALRAFSRFVATCCSSTAVSGLAEGGRALMQASMMRV